MLAAGAISDKWEPIETAPTDGTWICGAALEPFRRDGKMLCMTCTVHWARQGELWSWEDLAGRFALCIGFWTELPHRSSATPSR